MVEDFPKLSLILVLGDEELIQVRTNVPDSDLEIRTGTNALHVEVERV